MTQAARKAGQDIARTMAEHTREISKRAVERRTNDIGEVVKSNGKGRVEVVLPGVGISVTETDAYFYADPSSLQVDDFVAVMAVDNEYVVIGTVGENEDGAFGDRATTKGCVVHGADADKPRPGGYPSVEWIGSVEPLNAIENDTWAKP